MTQPTEKIHAIIADFLGSVMKHFDESVESYLRLQAALSAVQVILDRNPIVTEQNVTFEEVEKIQELGRELGSKIADQADKATGYNVIKN
jgi:hypothetical protein